MTGAHTSVMRAFLFTIGLLTIAASLAFALGGGGGLTGSGGGSSFAPASPGAIGGTTSSTGQFTNIAVGASVPALDGTTGDASVTAAFVCTTNNVSCVTQQNNVSSGTVRLLELDSANNVQLGPANGTGAAGITMSAATGNSIFLETAGTPRVTITGTQTTVNAGVVLQSTGGAAPTATCSGGSTGVSIAAGSTNNRGQIVTSSSASTNCTITWSASGTWGQAPFCVFGDAAASITPTAVSTGACGTSTCVLDFASATSKTFNWICL